MTDVCTVCKKKLGKEQLSEAGKKFCCKKCCNKYKDSKDKNVCEFC